MLKLIVSCYTAHALFLDTPPEFRGIQ